MTVAELIKKLQALPNQNHIVVVEKYSDYRPCGEVYIVRMVDKEGWYSPPYCPEDKPRAQDVVVIDTVVK